MISKNHDSRERVTTSEIYPTHRERERDPHTHTHTHRRRIEKETERDRASDDTEESDPVL